MSESETVNGTQLHFACNALIILCAMALFFLLLSWALGGHAYYQELRGNYALSILLAGIATGVVLRLGCQRRQQADDGETDGGNLHTAQRRQQHARLGMN